MSKTEKQWTEKIAKHLVGRKVVKVRYMSEQEREDLMWDDRAIVIQLDDGNLLFPSSDDEGNNAGAIFTNTDDLLTIPTIR